MRIEITQDPSGIGDYRWEIHTGPEHIDEYTGYCYSLGECFEEIVKWNTLNALHYTEETETEKLNLLHRYKKQTPEEVVRNAMKQAKEDGVFDEPTKPMDMDEVVDRLVKKYQVQKLWNKVRYELGYSIDCCDKIVDLVEDWIPEPQSAAGSQNIDVEFLVDGFNDCVRKMKEMLR